MHGIVATLFKEWVKKEPNEMTAILDYWFVLQGVSFELGERDFPKFIRVGVRTFVEVEMRVGMIGDQVSGTIPLSDQFSPRVIIHAFPTNKEHRTDFMVGERDQNALIQLLPSQPSSTSAPGSSNVKAISGAPAFPHA